jgi:ABC-2 type transport system permease protein
MSPFRSFLLVTQREMLERARTKSYLISTAVIILLVGGGAVASQVLPQILETQPRTVGVVPGTVAPGAIEETAGLLGFDVDVEAFPDRASGEAALEDDRIDALVVAGEIVFHRETDNLLVNIVAQAIAEQSLEERLAEAGLTVEQAQALLAPPEVNVVLRDADETVRDESDWFVGSLAAVVLFLVIMSTGNTVLVGVVEEKTSRVVEVLLGAMRPGSLLAGKVVGIASLGILQLLAGLVAGLLAFFVLAGGELDIPAVSPGTLPLAILYVVLGVTLYTFAYAAVGATVSRQEEATSAALPITILLMGAYGVAVTVLIQNPEGTLSRIVSIVPPLSPIAMPPRVALAEVPAWEIALSVALLVVATGAIVWLSERIYAAGILRQGPRLGILDALRRAERA